MAKLPQKEKLQGKYINLREITVDDAQFVLDLRCDEKKSRFLHKTENNLQKQIDYIKRYLTLDNEWYFIIEDKNHKPLGTVRIYDVEGEKYTGGSWLMIDGASAQQTVEGDFLMKEYSFDVLGFKKNCFDVRKENKKVVRFHKLCGAKIVDENDIDYFFELSKEDFEKNKTRIIGTLG